MRSSILVASELKRLRHDLLQRLLADMLAQHLRDVARGRVDQAILISYIAVGERVVLGRGRRLWPGIGIGPGGSKDWRRLSLDPSAARVECPAARLVAYLCARVSRATARTLTGAIPCRHLRAVRIRDSIAMG